MGEIEHGRERYFLLTRSEALLKEKDDMTELGFQKAQEKQPEGNPRRLHDVTEEEFVAEAAEAHENVLNEVLELREEAATLRRRIVAAVHARDKHEHDLD